MLKVEILPDIHNFVFLAQAELALKLIKSMLSMRLKGPKHEIFGFGFFYINQIYMDR
jgi:hypothetical protein